jgi:cyclic pyranopterin monophosphate synthase
MSTSRPDKPRYLHRARAEALVRFGHHARADRQMPSVLQTACVAGQMAARRASEILPGACAAEIDSVEVAHQWGDVDLRLTAEVSGLSRAGLASRALLAVNICATALVDALDEHADSVTVEQARVVEQSGGMGDLGYDFEPPLSAAVISISDAVASGKKSDRAAEAVAAEIERLADAGVRLVSREVLGDDAHQIEALVGRLAADSVDLVLTVGGTGLAHTDVTVDTVEPMLERPIPGIMEAARAHGQQLTPLAFMSRGVAGLIGATLVVTLPGSTQGAQESCDALFPAILHVFKTLRKSRQEG